MRIPTWARQLNLYLIAQQEQYKRDGFIPAKFDCCTFVTGWAKLITGVDHYTDYRDRYATAEEGRALLTAGAGSLLLELQAHFGEPVHPSNAQRGDIAYAVFGEQECCGIFFTAGARMLALFLGEGGFAMHRARDVASAFRVE